MVKYLIIIKSKDQENVMTGLNIAKGLKIFGAEDVKILFLGPGINALNKKFEISKIIFDLKEELIKNNIKILACENSMKNYNVNKEDLIYYDDIVKGGDIIIKYSKEGYILLTF